MINIEITKVYVKIFEIIDYQYIFDDGYWTSFKYIQYFFLRQCLEWIV